jgi:hypothetical protein
MVERQTQDPSAHPTISMITLLTKAVTCSEGMVEQSRAKAAENIEMVAKLSGSVGGAPSLVLAEIDEMIAKERSSLIQKTLQRARDHVKGI